MKKSFIAVSFAMLLCVCFSVVAFAIDTPWLPIEPDGAKTDTSSPDEQNSDTTDLNGDSAPITDAISSDTDTNDTQVSTEAELKNSDTAEKELPKETGCGSTLLGYTVLACCLTALTCAIKTRKENE